MVSRRAALATVPAALLFAKGWRPKKDFESRSQGWMAAAGVPAVSIALMEAGDLAWASAYGDAKPDTLFAAASLTKQVTAEAAMQLRDAGKLDFSKPLSEYVEVTADPRGRTVTARQVLSHSSGFPNWRFDDKAELKPAFEPGTKFGYSGEGYVWLQRVIEKVTGKGFELAVRELVFDPAGMKRSSLLGAVDGNAVRGHNRFGEPIPPPPPERVIKPLETWTVEDGLRALRDASRPPMPVQLSINAAASLWTTPTQYVQLMKLVRKRPEIREPVVKMIGPSHGGWVGGSSNSGPPVIYGSGAIIRGSRISCCSSPFPAGGWWYSPTATPARGSMIA